MRVRRLLAAFVMFDGVAPAHAAGARVCGSEVATAPEFESVAKRDPAFEPSPEVRVGPGFVLMSGGAEAACAPPQIARAALYDAVRAAAAAAGVDPALAVVLTSAPLSCASIYYAPIANDVRGIGYSHADAREIFDDSPDSALEGIAFLNDWPYWREHPEELASAFNHELGHRWGARVHVRRADLEPTALLGRDHDHWSYFLSTAGSPHEGNVWIATGASYRSQTPRFPSEFSPLDLYLMGVAPPEEVSPFTLLVNARPAADDCRGAAVSAASPPQGCAEIEFPADAVSISIDDVIAAEGTRLPAPSAGARIRVLPIVLESPSHRLSAAQCAEISQALEQRWAGFEQSTRGRIVLHDVIVDGDTCDDMVLPPVADGERTSGFTPPGCQVQSGPANLPCAALGVGAAFALLRRRHRGRARERRR